MSFFRLTMRNSNSGRPYTITFECDHPDIAALSAALSAGEIVAGCKITYAGFDKVRRIISRAPIAITRAEVTMIQLQNFELVDAEVA